MFDPENLRCRPTDPLFPSNPFPCTSRRRHAAPHQPVFSGGRHHRQAAADSGRRARARLRRRAGHTLPAAAARRAGAGQVRGLAAVIKRSSAPHTSFTLKDHTQIHTLRRFTHAGCCSRTSSSTRVRRGMTPASRCWAQSAPTCGLRTAGCWGRRGERGLCTVRLCGSG